MPRYEAIVHVTDPEAFIEQAYAARSGYFRQACLLEHIQLDGPRTVSAPGGYVSISSEDVMNVEDILVVDLGMDYDQSDAFIK